MVNKDERSESTKHNIKSQADWLAYIRNDKNMIGLPITLYRGKG